MHRGEIFRKRSESLLVIMFPDLFYFSLLAKQHSGLLATWIVRTPAHDVVE